MRAFTVLQPWASLLASGVKRFETRSCDHGAQIGERIAIHAGKRVLVWPRHVCDTVVFPEAWDRMSAAHYPVRGAIIATAEVVCVARANELCTPILIRGDRSYLTFDLISERVLGDWTAGRVVVRLDNHHILRTPVPARGALGFWRVPEAVEAAVIAAGGGE